MRDDQIKSYNDHKMTKCNITPDDYVELELCRAHTLHAHCTIYRVTFVCNFVNFRKIVEMLLVRTGGPGDKKHSLCTRPRLLGRYELIICCVP